MWIIEKDNLQHNRVLCSTLTAKGCCQMQECSARSEFIRFHFKILQFPICCQIKLYQLLLVQQQHDENPFKSIWNITLNHDQKEGIQDQKDSNLFLITLQFIICSPYKMPYSPNSQGEKKIAIPQLMLVSLKHHHLVIMPQRIGCYNPILYNRWKIHYL